MSMQMRVHITGKDPLSRQKRKSLNWTVWKREFYRYGGTEKGILIVIINWLATEGPLSISDDQTKSQKTFSGNRLAGKRSSKIFAKNFATNSARDHKSQNQSSVNARLRREVDKIKTEERWRKKIKVCYPPQPLSPQASKAAKPHWKRCQISFSKVFRNLDSLVAKALSLVLKRASFLAFSLSLDGRAADCFKARFNSKMIEDRDTPETPETGSSRTSKIERTTMTKYKMNETRDQFSEAVAKGLSLWNEKNWKSKSQERRSTLPPQECSTWNGSMEH